MTIKLCDAAMVTKKFPADEIEDYVDVNEFDICFEDNKN